MKIELNFKQHVTKLAGNPLGKKIYDEQLKDRINFNDSIEIVFPKQIDRIASSFIQGFFSDIIANIGIFGVIKQVTVKSETIPNIQQFVIENLE